MGGARMMVAGLVLGLAGMIALTTLQPETNFWLGVAIPGVLVGAGQGLLFAPLTAAGISGAKAADAGAASGVVNAFHQLGGALGLGITVTLAAAAAERSTAADPGDRFTESVTAALTGSAVLLSIALVVVLTMVVRPRRQTRTTTP
jgi:hypothetical protein